MCLHCSSVRVVCGVRLYIATVSKGNLVSPQMETDRSSTGAVTVFVGVWKFEKIVLLVIHVQTCSKWIAICDTC